LIAIKPVLLQQLNPIKIAQGYVRKWQTLTTYHRSHPWQSRVCVCREWHTQRECALCCVL